MTPQEVVKLWPRKIRTAVNPVGPEFFLTLISCRLGDGDEPPGVC